MSYRAWSERIRFIATEHRDMGHEWRFTNTQTDLLKKYYSANLLLLDCMNAVRGLTNKTRHHIENMMLLPWEETLRPRT